MPEMTSLSGVLIDDAALTLDELARACMGGGIDILMEDDPKYLAFLESRIAL